MENYYIFVDDQKTGPFDLVSMIKKIRNGRLQPHQLVLTEELEGPIEAIRIETLVHYFQEREQMKDEITIMPKALSDLDMMGLLSSSWKQYENHQAASMFVGIASLLILGIGLLLGALLPAGLIIIICSALAGSLIYIFMIYLYQSAHGRAIDHHFLQQFSTAGGRSLLGWGAALGTLCFALPLLSWLWLGAFAIILLFPGFLIFGLFLFTPLMWHDDELGDSVYSMMIASKRWVLSQDLDSIGKVLSVFAANCAAGLIFLFPIFISLPVTALAWIELYDHFYKPNLN